MHKCLIRSLLSKSLSQKKSFGHIGANTSVHHKISHINKKYEQNFDVMFSVVNDLGIQDWNQFSPEAKRATKNAVLLVGLLFKMCKVKLVKKAEQKDAMNEINEVEITESLQEAEQVFENVN